MQLYQPDENLPGLQVAFDCRALAKRLQGWFGNRELQLSIQNIRYKPGTSCLISYRVESTKPATFLHVKSFAPADWDTRKAKLNRDAWLDDEFSFAAFKFPNDVELPSIEPLISRPDEFLSRILFQKPGQLRTSAVSTLAYKPNRRFVARVRLESGTQFVLKLHDPTTFDAVVRTAKALKQSFAVDTPIRLGRSSRYRALAFEWIDGDTCDFAELSSNQREDWTRSVLDFLQRLQCKVKKNKFGLQHRQPTHGIESMADYLGGIYAPSASSTRKICNDILSNTCQSYVPKLIHGDFHDRQLIMSSGKLRACDFDNCCISDSTADLANLIAHLRYRSITGDVPHEAVEQTYELFQRGLGIDLKQETLSRLSWNVAASLFRLVSHPFRSGSELWISQTEDLLRELKEHIGAAKKQDAFRGALKSLPKSASIASGGDQKNSSDSSGMRVQILSDPKFDFLVDMFNELLVERVLQRNLPELEEQYGPYSINRIIPRRHKPGRRCLIEFELATGQGLQSVLGKVSAKRLDRRALQTQRLLFEQHLFGNSNNDGICVPRPLGSYAPWKMWLQEKVAAEPGGQILETDRLRQVTRRMASAVAKLHKSGLCVNRCHTLSEELLILNNRLMKVASELPTESSRIARVLKNCSAIVNSIENLAPVPIHRDFYQDQILFAEDKTYLVDLDLTSIGHPALDVGNLLAHLTEYGLRVCDDPETWSAEEAEIANHYLACNPSCSYTDIQSLKAVSFARHIHISWAIADRRRWNSDIVKLADQLTCELIPKSQLS